MKNKINSLAVLVRIISYSFLAVNLFLTSSCLKANKISNEPGSEINQDTLKGLKDYYRDYFPIGVAVAPGSLTGATSALILKQFGSLTAENVMKPAPIHPEENRYFWDDADKIVNYVTTN